ncbi:MAG: NUDIX domain-containing protein, partial [Actinobacteria bacterium]|nr:NUDIX domain-containing protein [Actinomycetota bacterium]
VVVAAIIQDSDGNFLCAKRGDWKSLPGKWEFPGGKALPDEELSSALIREIKEELSVDIKVIREFDCTTTGDIELVCFVCDLVGERPTTSTDHSELRWVSEKDLASLDWSEADLPAVKKIVIPYC